MHRIIKYYLLFLPVFSLLGIISSISRSVYQDSYVQQFLILSATLDFLIIVSGFRYMLNKQIAALFLLLFFSLVIGLLNNEISRRFITDFISPLFFFAKIFVFAKYWDTTNFNKYIKFYTRVAFIGSLVLLPVTYVLFNSTGNTRLAIFPPMELPFANYMLSSSMLTLVSFIVILLYGKRAQLFSAVMTFLFYTFFFKRKEIFKYLLVSIVVGVIGFFLFNRFSDNLAVSRLQATFDVYNESKTGNANLDKLSAGRYNEFETIISQMELKDYFLGKGMGFTYNIDGGETNIETANAHFSPIGFLSKYGLLFTIFVYYFLISTFAKTNKLLLSSNDYIIALGVSCFVFLESFFAYALFVTPILPVVLGVLISYQRKAKFLVKREAAILRG